MNAMSRRLKASALLTNAFALTASTVGSGALGLVFWVIAAHISSARDVGRVSAEVAGITLLSGLGQIGFVSIIARFLPVARRRSSVIIRRGYAGTLVVTWILACAFVALRFGRAFLSRDAGSVAIFVVSVLVFAVFSLQDVVLTAMRRAPWVLAENILVAVARLLLIPLVLVFGSRMGVLTSWAIPMGVAVIVVNWLTFNKLVPVKEALGDDRGLLPSRSELLSYGAAQFIGGVTGNIVSLLPPVLVASMLGPTASAVFYIPWLLCSSFIALLWNIVFSLVVEAVHDMARTQQMLKQAAWMVVVVTCGGGLVLGAGARLILSVVGSQYRDSGTVVLQLIALSLPFAGVCSLYGALALIDKRTWVTTILDAIGVVIFIGGGVLVAPRYGVAAFGLAFLFSQVLIALASVPGIVLRYRKLSVPDATLLVRLDREVEMMAAETQLIYPLFMVRNAVRDSTARRLAGNSDATTLLHDLLNMPTQRVESPEPDVSISAEADATQVSVDSEA